MNRVHDVWTILSFDLLSINQMTCRASQDDNMNNGLITKVWGSAGWTFGHSVTFGYPVYPTAEDKIRYKNYFLSLGDVLPCRFCRDSYTEFITIGPSALTDECLNSRDALTKWFYEVHNAVNRKLDVDYGISYEDMVDRYESFRAKCGVSDPAIKGCVAPLDYKAFSFQKLYNLDPPIVPLDVVQQFVSLARLRGFGDTWFEFVRAARVVGGDYGVIKKEALWFDRNRACQHIIRIMREGAKPSVEPPNTQWAGTPTILELKLLMLLSSNLCRQDLKQASVATANILTAKGKPTN